MMKNPIEREIQMTLKSPESLFENTDDVEEAFRLFPTYADRIADYLSGNSNEFKRVIITSYDLYIFVHNCSPESKNRMIEMILGDPQIFKQVVRHKFHISFLAEHFPTYYDRILEMVLAPQAFKRLLSDVFQVTTMAGKFPKYSDRIIEMVLEDPQVLKKVVSCNYSLSQMTKNFPEYADRIIEKVLENLQVFEQVVSDNYALFRMTENFPKYTNRIIEMALKNSQVFGQVVKANDELCKMVNAFSKYVIFSKKFQQLVIENSNDLEQKCDTVNNVGNNIKTFSEKPKQKQSKTTLNQNNKHTQIKINKPKKHHVSTDISPNNKDNNKHFNDELPDEWTKINFFNNTSDKSPNTNNIPQKKCENMQQSNDSGLNKLSFSTNS